MEEARIMSKFKHDHIIKLIGVCVDRSPIFIVMELCEKGSLRDYLQKNERYGKVSKILNWKGATQILISTKLIDFTKAAKGTHFLVHFDLRHFKMELDLTEISKYYARYLIKENENKN